MNDPQKYIGRRVRITRLASPQHGNPNYKIGDTLVLDDLSRLTDCHTDNGDEEWPLLFEERKQGVYADFEPTDNLLDALYRNLELEDEIDEDPEVEEIFIDLRGLKFDINELACILQRVRYAAINASDDPPELAKLTCLVD